MKILEIEQCKKELCVFLNTLDIFIEDDEHKGTKLVDASDNPRADLMWAVSKLELNKKYGSDVINKAVDELLFGLVVEK